MVSTRSILIINPNSTASMTDGLKPLIEALNFKETKFSYFTAPSGPKSINDEDDAADSLEHCKEPLEKLLSDYDGFLVACYSQHPMVPWLQEKLSAEKLVTGIFEASVGTSLQMIQRSQKFGIVSTGKVWEGILTEAVAAMLGTSAVTEPTKEVSARFAGVETTGLNATELHDADPELVRKKMKEATKRVLKKGDVGTICLGCAGMSGMNEMVREAAIEQLGEVEGKKIKIVDGVQAGAAWLEGSLRLEC